MNEQLHQRIQNFQMPQCTIGVPVLWFPSGRPSRQKAQVAYMIHCGGRTVTLQLATGRRLDAVRHIDDPKLQLNADQREQGAWDFTDEHKAGAAFRQEARARLDAIEAQLDIKDRPSQPGMSEQHKREMADRMRHYQALKKKALGLGIEVKKGMGVADIEAAISDAKFRANVPTTAAN